MIKDIEVEVSVTTVTLLPNQVDTGNKMLCYKLPTLTNGNSFLELKIKGNNIQVQKVNYGVTYLYDDVDKGFTLNDNVVRVENFVNSFYNWGGIEKQPKVSIKYIN